MRPAGTLPILTFHALDHRSDLCGFPPELFRDGIARLHRLGFRTLPLAAAVAAFREGQPPPPRTLVLTFDDGYRSVYTEAMPVLQDHGMTATVFLTVGLPGDATTRERLPTLNGREMLSWREIQTMSRAGIAFGAHTLTHPDLTRVAIDRLEAEICLPRTIIEQQLGDPVTGFAYPYGRFDHRSDTLVRHHFDFACTDSLGLCGPGSDPWALARVETFYLRSPRRFALIASRLFPVCLRALAIPRGLRRWVGSMVA